MQIEVQVFFLSPGNGLAHPLVSMLHLGRTGSDYSNNFQIGLLASFTPSFYFNHSVSDLKVYMTMLPFKISFVIPSRQKDKVETSWLIT